MRCCDHRAGIADEDIHRHAVENLEQADALHGEIKIEVDALLFEQP